MGTKGNKVGPRIQKWEQSGTKWDQESKSRNKEKFTPIFPGEREPLFAASVKLLQFALRVSSASAWTATFWRCLLRWFSPS